MSGVDKGKSKEVTERKKGMKNKTKIEKQKRYRERLQELKRPIKLSKQTEKKVTSFQQRFFKERYLGHMPEYEPLIKRTKCNGKDIRRLDY